MHDTSRELAGYTDPIYRPPSKPTELPLQEISQKIPLIKRGLYHRCINDQKGHTSKNHQN